MNGPATESTATIKEKIKVLIADEDKIKPFPDQKLCQIFENERDEDFPPHYCKIP